MLRSSTRVALPVLAATALLAGCGGSSSASGISADSYVKSVCQSVVPFEKDIQAKSSALDVSALTTPAQGKQALEGFMSAVVADTDTAINGLKAAGTPNVGNGKQISDAIVTAFTQLKAALQQAQTETTNLPTTSPASFKAAATTLGTSIKTSVAGISSSLSGLKSPDLEKAAKKVPACQSLGA